MRLVIFVYVILCPFSTFSDEFDIGRSLARLDKRLSQMICNPRPEIKDEIVPTLLNYNGLLYHVYSEVHKRIHHSWDVAYNTIYRIKGQLFYQAYVNLRQIKELQLGQTRFIQPSRLHARYW